MRTTVKLPKVGETAQVVVILEWLVEVGSTVSDADAIVQVETDKANVEVPSPVAGKMMEHLVGPQDEVMIGSPICVIETA